MQYHAMRVLMGEADEIRHCFFVAGHGHNKVDGCFGVCKHIFRRTCCYTMNQLLEAVRHGTTRQAFEHTNETVMLCWKDELAQFFSTIPHITNGNKMAVQEQHLLKI